MFLVLFLCHWSLIGLLKRIFFISRKIFCWPALPRLHYIYSSRNTFSIICTRIPNLRQNWSTCCLSLSALRWECCWLWPCFWNWLHWRNKPFLSRADLRILNWKGNFSYWMFCYISTAGICTATNNEMHRNITWYSSWHAVLFSISTVLKCRKHAVERLCEPGENKKGENFCFLLLV